jgi:hypothetical protein
MASDDKKTSPAPKNETAVEKKAAKKDEGQPKDKTISDAGVSKAEGGEKAATSSSAYSRGEGQKPVSKAYRDNWNAIYAKKNAKKKKR